MKHLIKYFILAILLSFIFGCNKHGYKDRYGAFYIKDSSTVFVTGSFGKRVDKKVEYLIKDYPNIETIIFGECPGSEDDENLIKAATLLRNRGINTHLTALSIIESGAVDLYLSGIKRTREPGSKIGVHAGRQE